MAEIYKRLVLRLWQHIFKHSRTSLSSVTIRNFPLRILMATIKILKESRGLKQELGDNPYVC